MANMITALRIPLAVAMLFTVPFSAPFWFLYLSCGFTDIVDGFVARMRHQESSFGAKIDSIADFVFAGCAAIFVAVNLEIPVWLWLCAGGIALLRFVSYGMGFYKYHTFAPLHTYANNLAGISVFSAPILFRLCGLTFTGITLCLLSFFSSLEELIMTLKSKELKRDCKSIFRR